MADANILKALEEQRRILAGTGRYDICLEKLILFGKVRCAIEKPNFLGSSTGASEGGAFAILDTYGVKCLGEDYFNESGSYNNQSVYFIKGSMVIYINSMDWVGKYVKVSGAYARSGVKVKQQYGHKQPNDGIAALAFSKYNNAWMVIPNNIIELGVKDPDIKITPLEDFMVKLFAEGKIEYPASIESILPYEGVHDYVEIKEVSPKSTTFVDDEERVDVSKIDLHLTYHLKGKELSPLYQDIKDDIHSMARSRKNYAEELVVKISEAFNEDESHDLVSNNIRVAFADRVATKFYNNIGDSTIKGKVYVTEFVERLKGNLIGVQGALAEAKPSVNILKESEETLLKLIQVDPSVLKETDIEGVNLPMLDSDTQVALQIISVTTGISENNLRGNYRACSVASSVSFELWYYSLLHCPYLLGLMGGTSLSIVECDKIYYSYTKYFTKDPLHDLCKELRDDLIYLQTLETADDKNTMVTKGTLSRQKGKYPGLGQRYISQNSFPAKKDTVELLKVMCNRDIKLHGAELENLVNSKWYSKERTDKLIEKGIVNIIDDKYLILERDLEKEFLIYETFQKKGQALTGITDEDVEETIEAFQEEKGFKLESLQKEGIKLCKYRAGVLSGCAGSGKTTTSDCMTECLQRLKGHKIIYGTPTGKACRRLAEVVGGTVKTIHSQFKIGLESEGYLGTIGKKYKKPKQNPLTGEVMSNPKDIYIFDEMAMCNTPLLYEIARNVSDDDLVYFLGDIKQLPPIGKGNPFYLLMQLLPCVELGVSKRAAEGSEVNYNTTLINCMSDGTVHELLYDNKTFFGIQCKDAQLPGYVTLIWQKLMEGSLTGTPYKEEDIQVISGYAKPDIIFSTTVLNKSLQQMLRGKCQVLFKHYDRDFYKNERVIHVNVNCYGMQRYVEESPGVLRSVVTLGMVNGEMGTLVDIIRSDKVTIHNFDEKDIDNSIIYTDLDKANLEELVKAREERMDSIRDDSCIKDDKTYFVRVKVYDVDLKKDVYVLYVARLRMRDGEKVLSGEDLSNLDLAYALTTHKMQGSQSPVVILPFGSSCNPNFINRNMINTMVTRSQGIVVMVGDIKGPDSPVTKGRQIPSPIVTKDIFSLLCE